MEFRFDGKVGSDKKLPFHFRFHIDQKMDAPEIIIETSEVVWLQACLLDSSMRLVLQYLHKTKSSHVPMGESDDYTSTCQNGLAEGDYVLSVYINTDLSEVDFVIKLIESEKALQKDSLSIIWSNGEYMNEGLELNTYDIHKIHTEGFRWYKGDFHTHTTISDGKQSPDQLMLQALRQELDFFVATEHNILPTRCAYGEVLVVPGMEITDRFGHFNAIGLTKCLDFRPDSEDGGLCTAEGMNRLMRQTREYGAICSVNHPFLNPWEWLYREIELRNIDTIEIINDPTYPDNREATEKALKLWDLLWQDGWCIWGIGGSDSHLLPHETYEGADKPSLIGDPGTYILCDGLSADGIIKGIHNGKIYVSRGPILCIEIRHEDDIYYPGDDLSEIYSKGNDNEEYLCNVYYRMTFSGIKDELVLNVIENGSTVLNMTVSGDREYNIPIKWLSEGYNWNRLELRKDSGELVLFTNPVYKNMKKNSYSSIGQIFDLMEVL